MNVALIIVGHGSLTTNTVRRYIKAIAERNFRYRAYTLYEVNISSPRVVKVVTSIKITNGIGTKSQMA
jgi:hypothetical protein